MSICRRTTSPIAIIFMVIFIIALVILLVAVGYTTYNNYYTVITTDPQEQPSNGTDSNFLQIEDIDLNTANLAGSSYVNDLASCLNLLKTQTVDATAVVFDEDTKFCALKGKSAGSSYMVDSSRTTFIQKAPVSYLLNWTRNAGSDVQGSEIFCSAVIGSQERAAAVCANDSTCQAYSTFVSTVDGVTRGCIKSSTTPLITDTTNTDMIVYTNPNV